MTPTQIATRLLGIRKILTDPEVTPAKRVPQTDVELLTLVTQINADELAERTKGE